MARYATALSFLLAILLLITLKGEAREIDFFSKFQRKVDQPPLRPSSEINTYIPTEEFSANINKVSVETNGFPRHFNEHSYVTVPQDNKETYSDDFHYPDKFKPSEGMRNMDALVNSGFELTAEEDKFFNKKEATNGYGKSYKNDHENVHAKEAQGMSDTRTLENGKYYYKFTRDNGGKGEYNENFGNSEYKSKYDEFRPLKDFEYNPQNQMGFIP